MSSQSGPDDDISKAPVLLKFRSSKWLIGFTVFTAAFTDGFLYGLVVPVLPFSLVQRSGVSPDNVQFWTSLLLVVFGVSMTLGAPIAGWVTNHSPARQVPFLAGLTSAFAATILFMIGTATWLLIVGRCLQGLSAGVVYTAGLSLLVDTVPRDEIGSWMGFALSGMNGGVLISPLLAGIIYEKAGYYPVFIMGLAVIAFDFILILVMIDKKAASKWLEKTTVEDRGSTSETLAFAQDPVVETHVRAESDGFPNDTYNAIDSRAERNQDGLESIRSESGRQPPDEESPLLGSRPLKAKSFFQRHFPATAALFGSPRILAAVYGCFIEASLITSFDAVLPIFVQRIFHWNSGATGTIFLTLTIPSLSNFAIGGLSDRYSPRVVALSGLSLTVPCLALLGVARNDSLADKIVLCVLLVLVGLGMNGFLTPLASDMSFAVERLDKQYEGLLGPAGATAEAYALFDCALGAGTVFGPAVSGFFYHYTTWAITSGVLALMCFSAIIPVMLYTPGLEKGRKTAESAG